MTEEQHPTSPNDEILTRHRAMVDAFEGRRPIDWSIWDLFIDDSTCLTSDGQRVAHWAVETLQRILGNDFLQRVKAKMATQHVPEGLEPSGSTITIWAVGEPCCILGLPNKLKEKKVNKKYIVKLTTDERAFLLQMISTGKAAARKLLHARILLKADASEIGPGWTDEHISQALEVSTTTIGRVRQQFVEQSLTAALERRSPSGYRPRRIDGEVEAHLIALACSPAPSGHVHWTIRLLADKLVELGYVEHVGRETVRKALKKTNSSRGGPNTTVFLLKPMLPLSARWKRSWTSTRVRMIRAIRRSAWMKRASSWSAKRVCLSRLSLDRLSAMTTNMSDKESVACSCALNHSGAGGM